MVLLPGTEDSSLALVLACLPFLPGPALVWEGGWGVSLGFKVIWWVKASERCQKIALGVATASGNTST